MYFLSYINLKFNMNKFAKRLICINSNISSMNRFYKSAICLQNLYPNSSLKITTPDERAGMTLSEKFSGYIPLDQLELTYSKSSGPGGQNVNKINTKVDLRIHLASATWLQEEIRNKLAENHKAKISKEGYLIFRSELTRNQQLNLADCLEKLRTAIRGASQEEHKVSDETAEKLRRRHERANISRLLLKRGKSQTKANRLSPNVQDLV